MMTQQKPHVFCGVRRFLVFPALRLCAASAGEEANTMSPQLRIKRDVHAMVLGSGDGGVEQCHECCRRASGGIVTSSAAGC